MYQVSSLATCQCYLNIIEMSPLDFAIREVFVISPNRKCTKWLEKFATTLWNISTTNFMGNREYWCLAATNGQHRLNFQKFANVVRTGHNTSEPLKYYYDKWCTLVYATWLECKKQVMKKNVGLCLMLKNSYDVGV